MAEVIVELEEFARKNQLSPFNKGKTPVRPSRESIFKTTDAKSIFNRTIAKISQNFCFADTSNLFQYFSFSESMEEIKRRQEFFRKVLIEKPDGGFLSGIRIPKQTWRPKYEVIIVTENEDTFVRLRELACPVQYVTSEEDIVRLEQADIIQVIDCENFYSLLERLPQTVFINSIEDVYLERFLEQISGWKENIDLIEKKATNQEIIRIIDELKPLLNLIEAKNTKPLSQEYVEQVLESVNENVMHQLKNMTLSGGSLIEILSKGKIPEELSKIIDESLQKTDLPMEIFEVGIPVKIDDKELNRYLRESSANEFTDFAEKVKKYSKELRQVPKKIEKLSDLLLVFDFICGIANFVYSCEAGIFPQESEFVEIENAKNIFLEKPQAVSFNLSNNARCSILTGANSGGKTTLLEHIVQLVSLLQLGLPINGIARMPLFSEVYYFAKNKGSMSKGAFETLLTQMAGIKPGKKTLVLADEMEAVTEPGVAASIVCATAQYFISAGCFLVVATHLGQEIQKHLPEKARIDGIEAKGLDENNELIVDHNPVLGRLANSTPELIVERLANKEKTDYFTFLNNYLKSKK